MVLVPVLGHIINRNGPIPAPRRDHRDFLVEGNEAFKDGRRLADFRPCRSGRCFFQNLGLPLAIIAKAPGLQD